ncbi:hypothetical protein E5C31_11930 [Providencia rettgeri]|nr:hypothetical protein [Providencia rettgeri]
MKIKHTEKYSKLRENEYMRISDQLDVLYKLAKNMKEKGFDMPAEVDDWIENCGSVKNKFKKN